MTREEAIEWFDKQIKSMFATQTYIESDKYRSYRMAIEALSAEATKKKAELKDNGDWDCPDVYCDECDHHRSVEWCSLAIPSYKEIDDTYKMVNEAFFEGFDLAEKRYRLLIETIEELDKKSADAVEVVRCKDCRHANECHKSVQYTRNELNTVTIGYSQIEWCSRGERREP